MPLRFDFISYELLDLVILGGVLIANAFLVLGGHFLRKDDLNLKYGHYLFIISVGIFLYSLFDITLPDVTYYSSVGSDHWKDIRYGYTYDFLRFQCINLALLVILGMSFVLIAYTNEKMIERKILFSSGISLLLASFMSLVNWGFYYFLVWLWPQDFLIYYDLFIPWQLFNLILSLIAFSLFFLFSFRFKQRYLTIFSVLTIFFQLYGIWDFLVIFEVFI